MSDETSPTISRLMIHKTNDFEGKVQVSAFLGVKNPDFKTKRSNCLLADQLNQSKIFNPFSVQAGTIFRPHLLKVYECAQSHLTLRPMDCIPPGSSVHGISQAKILEWVAISYSKKYKKTSRENCLDGPQMPAKASLSSC